MWRRPEFIFLCVALVTVAGSMARFGIYGSATNRIKSDRVKVVGSVSGYISNVIDVAGVKAESWQPPSAQRKSRQWVYDVFTPPEIFFDARLKEFTVTPPTTAIAHDETATAVQLPASLGVQLIGVKRTLFRLQLIGFVESERGYQGLFENTLTSETFLAVKGRVVPALNLVIEDVDVRARPVSLPESMTTQQTLATASVRDVLSGETIALTTAERCYAAAPRATLITGIAVMAQRDVCNGDVIEVDGVTYEIGEIQLAPPSVTICRRGSAQVVAERRTLSLQETKTVVTATPST